jgi:AcrR family transcriptional regulator
VILDAAVEVFRRGGYHAATLEEVAVKVGITRGAVLYHFRTKADLLAAVVEPLLVDVDAVIASLRAHDRPTPAQRREMVASVTDVLLRHRQVVNVVTRDAATYAQPGVGERLLDGHQRTVALLCGTDPDPRLHVRAIAAVHLLTSTVASRQQLAFDGTAERDALVDAALGALAGPPLASASAER